MLSLAVAAVPALAAGSASAGAGVGARATVGSSANRAATYELVRDDYKLDEALLAHISALQAAEAVAAEGLGRECRGVLKGAPDELVLEEEGPSAPHPDLSGGLQAERARSEQEKQILEHEVGQALEGEAQVIVRGADETYAAAIEKLHWSEPEINALIQRRAEALRAGPERSRSGVCAELRAWAASDFRVLPPGAKRLQETEEAPSHFGEENLRTLLAPYEDAASRALLRRVEGVRKQLMQAVRADAVAATALVKMDLALGEKVSRSTEQQLAPVIARGKTAAGSTFVIRAAVPETPQHGCAHSVNIEINERESNGGSSGELCLGKSARSRPSGECSGPVETIKLVTTPTARKARVLFSNARSVRVSVIQIPAKDGGPGGVLIDAFRGYDPYPVSVQELSSNGHVLATVSVARIRCEKETPANSVGVPQFIALATATTPSGEPLTVTGTLHRVGLQTEFFLGPQSAKRDKKAHDEAGHPKLFQWELATECAPHAYSMIAGLLPSPGATVLARTPSGLTPLTKVELPAGTHTQSPLFYGVYTTPPTEIIVKDSEGSTLYTENLATQATEETEYCAAKPNSDPSGSDQPASKGSSRGTANR
jgi:hypothetical protein